MRNFQVKAFRHFGTTAWAIVRDEPGSEPIMVGLPYSDPDRALVDANLLNLYAAERKQRGGRA